MKNIKSYILLHAIIFLYSFVSVCSKYAAREEFLSIKWIVLYGVGILLLGVYAILWQQVLKRVALNTACANKAVAIIWGLLWGVTFFNEQISSLQLIGAVVIVIGVIITVAGGKKNNE